MKNIKRILSLILAISLVIPMGGTVFAGSNPDFLYSLDNEKSYQLKSIKTDFTKKLISEENISQDNLGLPSNSIGIIDELSEAGSKEKPNLTKLGVDKGVFTMALVDEDGYLIKDCDSIKAKDSNGYNHARLSVAEGYINIESEKFDSEYTFQIPEDSSYKIKNDITVKFHQMPQKYSFVDYVRHSNINYNIKYKMKDNYSDDKFTVNAENQKYFQIVLEKTNSSDSNASQGIVNTYRHAFNITWDKNPNYTGKAGIYTFTGKYDIPENVDTGSINTSVSVEVEVASNSGETGDDQNNGEGGDDNSGSGSDDTTNSGSIVSVFKINGERANIFTLDSNGGDVYIKVITEGVNKENLGVKIDDGSSDIDLDYRVSGDKNAKNVIFSLPSNLSEEDKIYTISFAPDKNNPVYNSQVKALITVKAGKETILDPEIEKTFISIPNLPLSGGTATINLYGKNLHTDKFSVKLYEINNGEETLATDLTLSQFSGKVDQIMTASINVPTSEKDRKFVAKVYVGNELRFTESFEQSKYGSLADDGGFSFDKAYLFDDKTLVIEFQEFIYELVPGSLKDIIKIKYDFYDKNSDFVSLEDLTSAEIVDKNIILKFNNSIKDKFGFVSKLEIKGRSLVKEDGLLNNFECKYLINKNSPVITSAEFVKGYILENEGGEVEIKLSGANLINFDKANDAYSKGKSTVVQVAKNEKLDANGKVTEISNVKVTGEGNEQYIRFTLPENKTDRTETYSVLVSLNGGRTFSSAHSTSLFDRNAKLVAAVLPEGKTKEDQTLSFMRIRSYRTASDGQGVPDITHTTTPIQQESKKTFVYIFGTNLDKNKTKVRIKSYVTEQENREIYWYPVNDSSKDSGDRFIMVAFDGTGIDGSGNLQKLEVICPRGYSEDMTYTYQIAMDGVNFDEEIVVRATVEDDGENGGDARPNFTKNAKDITVSYVDEKGQKIAEDDKYTLMKNLPLSITQAQPKKIEKYEYLTIKGFETNHNEDYERLAQLEKDLQSGKITSDNEEYAKLKLLVGTYKKEELKEKLGDRNKIVFVYKTIKNTPSNSTSNSPNYYPNYYPSSSSASSSSDVNKKNDKEDKGSNISTNEVIDEAKVPLSILETSSDKFKDISNHWAEENINFVVSKNLFNGISEKEFAPEAKMTRAMFVTVLGRLAEVDEAKIDDSDIVFSDVAKNSYYSRYVKWAFGKGVVKGLDENTFAPNLEINREQMAVMIVRYAEKFGVNLSDLEKDNKSVSFDDSEEISDWAKISIDELSKVGIIDGDGNNFYPQRAITRAEVATVIKRLFKLSN